jgi:peptidoglycan/xylan/chitin deacetylase (PgdA/CDA1 family)
MVHGVLKGTYGAFKKTVLDLKLDGFVRMLRRGYVILMYHSVPFEATYPYDVSKCCFEEQLRHIQECYEVLSIPTIVEHIENGRIAKSVCGITFDDGYKDNYEIAYPLLLKYEVPASIFISTAAISNDENDNYALRMKHFNGKQMLGWHEIEEMKESGLVTVASHSHSHPNLVSLSDEEVVYELETSKRMLRDRLNVEVDLFSAPQGFMDSRVRHVIKAEGFRAILTSEPVINYAGQSCYELGRMCVQMRNMELPSFAFKILGIQDGLSKMTEMWNHA